MAILNAALFQGASWITYALSRNDHLGTKVLAASSALYVTGRIVYLLHFAPLSKIPGSWISKLTFLKIKFNALFGLLGDACEDDYYKYGDIYVIGPNVVTICDPADCRTVLSTHRFAKSEMYEHFVLIDHTMFTTRSAEVSHVRRRQVGPAFTPGYLTAMEPTILECGIHSMRQKWDGMIDGSASNEAVVPYSQHFSLVSFDIVGALGYGQRFNSLKENSGKIVDWVKNYNRLAQLYFAFPIASSFPFNLTTRSLVKSKDDLSAFGDNAAELRREKLKSGALAEKPKDLLQALIDTEDPESRVRMTQKQITAQNIGFLIGGTDTTSLTMSWTLHYLLLYPDIYKRAVREVRSKFSHSHTITYSEGKSQLPFIDACIYESMRIRAVSGVILPRIVPKGGATFQGHFLPGGTQICVNVAGANHHKETWENSRHFMPERFLGDGEKRKHDVLTFSAGIRICPGRNLAKYEMISILANLLKDYDLSLPHDALFRPDRVDNDGYPVVMPRINSVTVKPKYPERDCLVVIKRASASSFGGNSL
ncbi:hypothetical protein LPJ59_003886 [Coemansia sp. RSA 2399]|nr:hypothetical protein LPJ59_003886 [Coemansia sp. RSA 2399]KAJ1901897.1 hypothetical protein LPJ81_003682 [Coemansia sp. IMI 209127]